MIIALACVLIVLLYTTRDPLWFGVAFAVYSIFLPLATMYLNRQIVQAVAGSRERIQDDIRQVGEKDVVTAAVLYQEGVNEVESYFLKLPQMTRFWLIAMFSVIGTIVAAIWKIQGDRIVGVAAYVIFLLTIIVSEAVILGWRMRRDQRLHAIATELSDLIHDRQ